MSVSIIVVRAVVDSIARTGVSCSQLLSDISLAPEHLHDPERRIVLEDFGKLMTAAADLTGDSSFGMRVVDELSHGSMGLLAHLVSHARTVRDALATATQFAGLAIDGVSLPTYDEDDQFVIRCLVPRSTPPCERVLAEMVMIGMMRLIGEFTGSRVEPRHVGFAHDQPSQLREYERYFGSNVRFGQKDVKIAFDRELADRQNIHQHPELFGFLRAEAERRLDRLQAGVSPVERLRGYLLTTRSSAIPEMAEAARNLGMSERSLRRHLAAEGTSYRELVQSQLKNSALQLLRDSKRSIKEIAVSLGFVNAAAFTSAFKRWTGVTPGEYRKKDPAR